MRASFIIPRIAALALVVLTLAACARSAPAAPDSDAIDKALAPTPVSTPTQGGAVSARARYIDGARALDSDARLL